MRLASFILVLMVPFLLGCKILPSGDGQSPVKAQETRAAAATTGESDGQDATPGVRPKPRPAATSRLEGSNDPAEQVANPDILPSTPVKRQEQVKCEKQGGSWRSAGKSAAKTCIKPTRDSGKQCRKKRDCDSECLARSGTCAPVKPLFGCNEVLQNDGRRVTLCID